MIRFTIIFSVIILYSCQKYDDSFTIKDYPSSVIDLEHSQIELDGELLMPSKIICYKDRIIIFNDVEENLFQLFSQDNGKLEDAFGRKGRGPNELGAVMPSLIYKNTNGFEFCDIRNLYTANIHDGKLKVEKIFTLPDGYGPHNGVLLLDDSIIIADNYVGSDDYFEHVVIDGLKGEVVKKFGKYPANKLKFKTVGDKETTFMKSLTKNDVKKRFAVFYTYLNRFKIYNYDFEELYDIVIEDEGIENFSLTNRKSNVIYNVVPVSNNERIYVLNVGVPKSEFERLYNSTKSKILVLDWDGNLINQFRLDQAIISFDVTSDDKYIYTTSISESNLVNKYPLPMQPGNNMTSGEYHTFEVDSMKLHFLPNFEVAEINGAQINNYTRGTFKTQTILFGEITEPKYHGAFLRYTFIRHDDDSEIELEQYFENVIRERYSNVKEFKYESDIISDNPYYKVFLIIEDTDPRGKPVVNKSLKYYFKYSDKIVEISFSSESNFDDHGAHVEQLFNTFISSLS